MITSLLVEILIAFYSHRVRMCGQVCLRFVAVVTLFFEYAVEMKFLMQVPPILSKVSVASCVLDFIKIHI